WLGRYGLALGLVQLLVLGGGLFAAHRHPQWLGGETRKLLAWPPVGIAIWLVLQTMILPAGHLAVATILTLVSAMSFVLAGFLLGYRWLFGAGSIALTVGLHSAVASATDGSIAALSLVSQGLMLGAWAISRRFAGRSGRSEPTAYALRLAGVACCLSGLLWIVVAADQGSLGIEPLHLLLIAVMLAFEQLDRERRLAGRKVWSGELGTAAAVEAPWRLQLGLLAVFLWLPLQSEALSGGAWLTSLGFTVLAFGAWTVAEALHNRSRSEIRGLLLDGALFWGGSGAALAFWDTIIMGSAVMGATNGSPWLSLAPLFLASLFFVFQAAYKHHRLRSAWSAAGLFVAACFELLARLEAPGPELYCLGPGLACLALSRLLGREIDDPWRDRLFTTGAACLYAMPVMGLLDQLSWGWQIVLLLLAVGFGAASFRLRSRSLLTVSTAALVIDLACFLIRLRQTEPLLLWVAGVAFGLGLMALAGLLEHRREMLLQHLRIWGQELRSWA
ncbi:MAG: hypothetical protein AAF560_28100, partial [Acidobacteriota bacterium]